MMAFTLRPWCHVVSNIAQNSSVALHTIKLQQLGVHQMSEFLGVKFKAAMPVVKPKPRPPFHELLVQ